MHPTDIGRKNPQQLPALAREMRSGRYFAAWGEQYVMPMAPSFDVEGLLKASIALEDASYVDLHLFGLSPLSSPDTTPPPTPPQSPHLVPLPLSADHPITALQALSASISLQESTPLSHAQLCQPAQSQQFMPLLLSKDKPTFAQQAISQRQEPPAPSPAQSPCPTQLPLSATSPLSADQLIPVLQGASSSVRTQKESDSRKSHKKQQGRANRNRCCQDVQKQSFAINMRKEIVDKYVNGAAPIFSQINTQESNVAQTGYVALDNRTHLRKLYWLLELIRSQSRFKLRLIEWDGRAAIPIVDTSSRVIGILAGYPGSTTEWLKLQEQASHALEDARHRAELSGTAKNHRRGRFQTLKCRVSHGGGQTKPTNCQNSDINGQIAKELNAMECFKHFASFATSITTTWAPNLYNYYVEHLGALHARHPELQCNFTSSIFSASTYNLGPQTACYRHTDFANLPYGWCAVTALGLFNPNKGGHLVLWECGLIIEFPPSSTILLPLAIVSHSNVAIDDSETCYSFTQYTAGGLFCWVDNDFQTMDNYRALLTPTELLDLEDCNNNRRSFGLSLLTQLIIPTASSATLPTAVST